MKEGIITLSQKQLKTFTVINRFIDKSITRQQATELSCLSPRQITRIKKEILQSGADALIHKNISRKPPHAFSDETKKAILTIYSRPELSGINFLHFKDILIANFGIDISYSALLSILKTKDLKFSKRKKSGTAPIAAKENPHSGQLIQINATPYEWFGGKIRYSLHGR